jgi:hypothetical protein
MISYHHVVVMAFCGPSLRSKMWCVPLRTAVCIVSTARCVCNVLHERFPYYFWRSRRVLQRNCGLEITFQRRSLILGNYWASIFMSPKWIVTCLTCAIHRSGALLLVNCILETPWIVPVKELAWFYLRMWENMAWPVSPFFSYGALQAFITPLKRVQVSCRVGWLLV